MLIKKLDKKDLDKISKMHMESFKGFFLSMLGERFLKIFYQSVNEDNKSITIIGKNSKNHIIGVVVGSTDPAGFYFRILKKNILKFAIAALPAAIKNPSIIPRLFRAISKPKDAKKKHR